MPRRAAKFASALFVNLLAGIPLATIAHSETPAAEDCLSAPKGETPPGSHWRYHIDHINKRNCWYLRREGGAVSQALPQNTPPAPSPSPSAKPSIADAHAELRSRPAYEESSVVNPPATPVANEAPPTNASVWNATAAVATRWPELPAASTSNATPATASPASSVTQSSADQPQTAAPTAPLANFLYVPVKPETIPTLIAAAFGALAFAGAAALISSRRGRTRRLRRREARHARGPLWETTDDDRIVLSDHLSAGNRNYRPRFARSVDGAAAAVNRTPEFARRRSRPAPG
jgi:hypothetical protein